MKQAFQIKYEDLEFFIDEDARIVFFEFIEKSELEFQKTPEYTKQWESFKKSLKKRIKEYVSDPNKVISLSILEMIINQISNEFSISFEHNKTRDRKLYRNTKSSILGGVCSGIADFLNIETTLVRILFIFFAFIPVFGIITYIILWIVIPPVIQNEKPNVPPKTKTGTTENPLYLFFKGIGRLIIAIFQSISSLIGFVLVMIGIFIILGYFNWWPWHFFHNFHFRSWHMEWPNFFYDLNHDKLLFLICLALCILIPVFAIIYKFLKTIFGINKSNKKLKFTMFLLWFLCVLGAIGILISNNNFETGKSAITHNINLGEINSSIIYIDLTNSSYPETGSISNEPYFFKYNYLYKHGDKYLYGQPKINIIRSDIPGIHRMTIEKNVTFGFKDDHYQSIVNEISYQWNQNDSLIELDKYFYAKDLHWWNFPKVTIDIIIPKYKDVMYINPDEFSR